MSGGGKTLAPLALLALVALLRPAHAGADEPSRATDEAVHTAVDRHAPMLRRCFARGLRDRPDLGRKLVVRFRVAKGGRASAVSFVARQSTLRDRGVERCIDAVFRAIKFPRQAARFEFTSPLVFPAD